MMRDPLIIVATLSLAGLAFFLLVEHVPKWARALAWSKPFDGIRKALAPIALPGWIKTLGMLAWSAMLLTLLAGMFFVILTGLANLPGITPETAPDLRWYLLTLTAITAALGAVIALPFTLRRTVQNERQTRTAEEGYITQQINEAVANLAAEKEVNKVGRVISYQPTNPDERWFTTYETVDKRHRVAKEIDGSTIKKTAWEPVKITEPNIEVRIGAILALERLARQRAEIAVREKDANGTKNRTPDGILDHDAARDHVRIMEILCAYVRENTPAQSARPLELKAWPEKATEKDKDTASSYANACVKHRALWSEAIGSWKAAHDGLRSDIQLVLRVLGRRITIQRSCEGSQTLEKQDRRGTAINLLRWQGYRLDLRRTNLQRADLAHSSDRPSDFAHARLAGAQMQGADLVGAKMQSADLFRAELQGADLSEAQMQGASLREARLQEAALYQTQLQGADLVLATMQGARSHKAFAQGADLSMAFLQGADLSEALLQGADFSKAQLNAADLTETQMGRVNLQEAKLQSANLDHAFLQLADLRRARLDADTSLYAETLHGAGLKSLSLWIDRTQPNLYSEAFGDSSVKFEGNWPTGCVPGSDGESLSHWSAKPLDGQEFERRWRDFQKKLVTQSDEPD